MREYVRRVQLVGGSTLTVALPKEWASAYGIGKGSELRITVLPGGGLLVEPLSARSSERGAATARVRLSGASYSSVLRRVVSFYIAGARVIEIEYEAQDASLAEALAEQLRSILLGVEVLEAEPGVYRLYAVLDDYSVGFWDAYAKMRRAVVGMMESLEAALSKRDPRLALEIVRKDDIVDRLYLYLARQLTKSLLHGTIVSNTGLTPAEAPHAFLGIKSLERIGDHVTIVSSIAASSVESLHPLLDYVGSLRELVASASHLLRDPDLEEANKWANEASKLAKKLRELRDESSSNPPLSHAALSLARIGGYAQDILEASIDRTIIRMYARKTDVDIGENG